MIVLEAYRLGSFRGILRGQRKSVPLRRRSAELQRGPATPRLQSITAWTWLLIKNRHLGKRSSRQWSRPNRVSFLLIISEVVLEDDKRKPELDLPVTLFLGVFQDSLLSHPEFYSWCKRDILMLCQCVMSFRTFWQFLWKLKGKAWSTSF